MTGKCCRRRHSAGLAALLLAAWCVSMPAADPGPRPFPGAAHSAGEPILADRGAVTSGRATYRSPITDPHLLFASSGDPPVFSIEEPDGIDAAGPSVTDASLTNFPPPEPMPPAGAAPPADAAPKPDAPAPEEKKEKKWYEKYGFRGYAQFRINTTTHHEDGTATAQHAGDSSIGNHESFLIRRARVIWSADISDHLYVYLQPDFASTPPGSTDGNHFAQIRDWYGDVYLDTDKVCRFRVGQSKVPYGWENLQSSSNRVPLDRNDAFNSATRNERDLGVFFYWTPKEAQDLFTKIMDEGLKGSGNYGVFGIGAYNGQGGSFREENDNVHLVARLTWPWEFENGQIVEAGIQAFTGEYVVIGAPIRPLGMGGADMIPANTRQTGGDQGLLDQRLGWTWVYYPQPLGFQAEWTIGRGPALNDAQTAVERSDVHGGYVMALYKLDTKECGTWFPFCRWQYFHGGYRSARNAPYSYINEWEFGAEWQIRKEMELSLTYLITDRTNLDAISSSAAMSEKSYRQFEGQVLRAQFQINY
jgi:hypothetical protein